MPADQPKCALITPVRDEQAYLPLTIESVVRQTCRPVEWVLVNDGSKDNTADIIEAASREHPWIRAVHRKDRGHRKWGAGIIEAFYDGVAALSRQDWDYLSKLDGDLSFEPDYFERAFKRFEDDPRLGIGGGVLYHYEDGHRVRELHPTFHVRGGVKIYRRALWTALGGLWVGPGSDTLDEVKANMLGWTTRSFADLQLLHHRFTGSSWGRWGGMVKDGKTDYVCGYHPLFLLAKSASRIRNRPYFVASLALLYGYVAAQLEGMPQVNDPSLIRYLRRQQLAKLTGRETIWK
jgi:biofilm PGA synthesis N-glycosyltransferase PgaC